MKKLIARKSISHTVTIILVTFCLLAAGNSNAQEYELYSGYELELLDQENMNYMKQIDKIVEDYPAFEYTYTFDNREVKNVTVTGVDNVWDRKRLEVALFDLQSNRNELKGKSNSMGVFYNVDTKPRYKNGDDALERTLQSNLKYPENAQNWGVEGTVYVKFVIDDNGNIPFATTTESLDSPSESYVKELKKQAVQAVKATSGDWIPGKIEGVEVASLAVAPIKFDLKLDPNLGTWIR